jgi:hypothetical protein
MEQVKLLSLTAVLTILIWWSADSLVNERMMLGVTVDPRPPVNSPDMRVAVEGEAPLFQMEVSGPRKTIEEFRSKGGLKVRLTIPDRPTGPYTMPLDRSAIKQALSDQWRNFRKVSVNAIDPTSLPLQIDHIVTKTVEIVARRLALSYEVAPQLQPTSATVRMRESEFNKLPPGQALQIGIGPDVERVLKDQPAGRSVSVPITLDARRFGPDATITPSRVDVTATVQAERATADIPTVPILFAVSFANLEKRLRPVTRDGDPLPLVTQTITVTGPRADVARLQRGETRAYGTIQLKQEDFEILNVVKLVTPEYRLPKGIELAHPASPIEFKLVPVDDTTPPK